MQRNANEIGSEFWLERSVEFQHSQVHLQNSLLVLSGRTAIDLVIQDILRQRKVAKVYMPAWGCDSMIAPFVDRDISIDLYDVSLCTNGLHYDVDENITCDIFYINNYFGYHDQVCNEVVEHFKNKGAIILYDRTHSFLMQNDSTVALADYSIASIRKWMGVVCGALITKKSGIFDYYHLADYSYLADKIEAMQEKALYINGESSIDKQSFLAKFSNFGHHLVHDYKNYKMDDLSFAIYQQTDLNKMRKIRRGNAKILHENLELQFIDTLNIDDSPLFVPVFFESRVKRDLIRNVLISENIYCPIHWPKNCLIDDNMKVNSILDKELSLICDQRYNENHMQRIVDIISKNI